MILHILKPEAEDYKKLTDICFKSNKHWGYPDYLIDLWKDELTITPRYIRNHNIIKVQNEHYEILGFGVIESLNGNGVYEILHLWVLPEYMDKNIGRLLLEKLEQNAGPHKTIKVVSDPNVMSFYQDCGYQKVGEVKSRPDGRKLPLMKKILNGI
ncbi:MAG: GNAT family N-acetyltransferase [Cytophagales bacterium]|nr:GNAT family N-acetyltransferase [Cytophagales bacterium]